MPSIVELRATRLAAVASIAKAAPATAAPAAPVTAAELAATRADLEASLANIDRLIAGTTAAPAAAKVRDLVPASLQGLTGDAQLRAEFAADPDLLSRYGGNVDAYLGMRRHETSGAGRAERNYAAKVGAPKGTKASQAVSADANKQIGSLYGEALWKAQYATSEELRSQFHSEGAYLGFKANEKKITGGRR